jgi:hypothetical protein
VNTIRTGRRSRDGNGAAPAVGQQAVFDSPAVLDLREVVDGMKDIISVWSANESSLTSRQPPGCGRICPSRSD